VTATCHSCGAALVAVPGTAASHEVGTVNGTLDGPARWRCPDDHEQRSADLDEALAQTVAALTVARRTRVKGTLRCGACNAPFAMPGRRAIRSVTIVDAGIPATRITLDIPVIRCTEDAAENLPPECVDDLRALLVALLGPSTGTETDARAGA
jgi:hypothetical protein